MKAPQCFPFMRIRKSRNHLHVSTWTPKAWKVLASWATSKSFGQSFWDPGSGKLVEDNPDGPSTQYLRTLVPNTIKGMVFGTFNMGYLDPLGKIS